MHLAELTKHDSFLVHINHASILLKHNGQYLLCDPWYISPAFNNWTQNPPPPAELIEFIMGLNPNDLSVVVSHGHDDHLDDYFIKHHLSKSRFFIPTFQSPGLVNRVVDLTGRKPELLSVTPHTGHKAFKLSRLINNEFTSFDSIIVIETDRFTVIHANDNWHVQPPEVLSELGKIKQRCSGPFFYLSQLGIADCFPQCYPQYSDQELLDISSDRLKDAIAAAGRNLDSQALTIGYSYANQSRIVAEFAKPNFAAFDLVTGMIRRRNRDTPGSEVIQLMPGDHSNLLQPPGHPAKLEGLSGKGLINDLIIRLEREANLYIGIIDPGPVSFKLADEIQDATIHKPGVIYAASRIVWQRILTGVVNIETISIGGGGMIFKTPREFNIRKIHEKISNFSYVAQGRFKRGGLGWLYSGQAS